MAKKYLIIQTAFIGDVILATPIVESLKKEQSDILIDVLVKKENSSVLYGNRNINEVFTLDKSKKLNSIFSLIRAFRKKRYDCIINLHRFASSDIRFESVRVLQNDMMIAKCLTHSINRFLRGKEVK